MGGGERQGAVLAVRNRFPGHGYHVFYTQLFAHPRTRVSQLFLFAFGVRRIELGAFSDMVGNWPVGVFPVWGKT